MIVKNLKWCKILVCWLRWSGHVAFISLSFLLRLTMLGIKTLLWKSNSIVININKNCLKIWLAVKHPQHLWNA